MPQRRFRVFVKVGLTFLFLSLFLKIFIGEWVYIPSDSMLPTLCPGNLAWNSKIAYGTLLPRRMVETPVLNLLCLMPRVMQADRKRDWGYHRIWKHSMPQRMDVIVFKWIEDHSQLYIKRIIGMPKDTIQIKCGIIYINNEPIKEEGRRISSYDNYGPVVVDENSYFVMGDFRSNSLDSRLKGTVPFSCVVGKATHIWWKKDRKIYKSLLHKIK